MNAFVAAMGQERFSAILEHAQRLIVHGYVENKTYEEVVDQLISIEYDKEDGNVEYQGALPRIAKIEDSDFDI